MRAARRSWVSARSRVPGLSRGLVSSFAASPRARPSSSLMVALSCPPWNFSWMRQAIMRQSKSLVRAGGGSLQNILRHRARRSSLSRNFSFSTSDCTSAALAFFMTWLGFSREGIQRYEAASGITESGFQWSAPRSRGLAVRLALAVLGADDAIHALAVELLRHEGQAQLLADCAGKE